MNCNGKCQMMKKIQEEEKKEEEKNKQTTIQDIVISSKCFFTTITPLPIIKINKFFPYNTSYTIDIAADIFHPPGV